MRIDRRGRVRALLARAWDDRRGVVAVMLAILLPVIIGAVELGVEPGIWYAIVGQDQSAADAAALTAAYEVAAGLEENAPTPVSAQVTSATARDAARNGFDTAANAVTVNCPPASGSLAGTACALPTSSASPGAAVEVVLQQQETALLPSVLSSLTLGARAVAQLTTKAQACALALGTTGTVVQVNAALTLTGTASEGCALAANSTDPSSIALASGSSLASSSAACVSPIWSAGNYVSSGSTLVTGCASTAPTPQPTTNSFPLQDPYSPIAIGTVPSGACQTWTSATATAPPSPGVLYCSITFAACGTSCTSWTLPAGVYYLDGGNFTIANGATVSGTGVTIVLTAVSQPAAGTINISGGKVTLSAPLAGTGSFAGMLFVQDPATADPLLANVIEPTAGSARGLEFNGLIYTPKSPIQINVASPFATCTAVIAQSIVFSGSATTLTNAGCSSYGVNPAPIVSVALAE